MILETSRKSSSKSLMALALGGAAVIALAVKPSGHATAKIIGALLALTAVLPVFIFVRRALATGSPNRLLGTFVGGFLFKLVIILAGVWWQSPKPNWIWLHSPRVAWRFCSPFKCARRCIFGKRNPGRELPALL